MRRGFAFRQGAKHRLSLSYGEYLQRRISAKDQA